VTRLLKESGVDLSSDNGPSTREMPAAVAQETVNMNFVSMPATFDHEGDETACRQGLLPGKIEPALSVWLDLSGSD